MTSTTGPRTTRRRRLLPAVALVAVTGIVTGSFALADGAPPPSVGGAAAAYVPADGYVSWSLHTGSGTDIRRITEHSRSTGVNQVLALPPLQQSPTLDAVGEGVATTHFWRETTRALDGDDTRQLIDLYSVTDVGVSLVASYGGDYGWVYSPPIVQLPADISPGSTWGSSGDAMHGLIRYEHTATAITPRHARLLGAAASAEVEVSECIQVDSSLGLSDDTSAELADLTQHELWCAGRGRIAAIVELDGGVDVYEPHPPSPELRGITLVPERTTWSALDRWSARGAALVRTDEFYGDSAITIFLAESPRTTASGLIVVADVNVNDLLAFAIDGDTLHRQWIAHPGGPVVTYATAGDVTLASTAQRQLVAYDDNGVRLWQTAVPELVVAPPTATEDGRFVTVGLDGTVTLFDALTGEPAWSHGLGTDVERSAVVTGDTVTVIDRAGTMTALSIADGEVLWSHAGSPAMGLIALDTTLVVAGADGWVRAISAETGQLGHSWRYPGAWRALLNLDDVVVVASSEITLGLDPKTGRELWWGSGVESMVGDGVVAVALLDSTATAINARGERLAEWDVPESFAWSTQYVVATRDGILLMHSGSDATILGAR